MRGHGGVDAFPTPPQPQPPDSDCTDWYNHTVVAYRSTDLATFEALGTVFDPSRFASLSGVIMYRPHVLWSPVLRRFVMWYKTLSPNSAPKHWYGVAAADTPSGPFEIIVDRVPGIWQGDGGTESDHFLFVDDDGSAYFTRYHSVQKLNATFTGLTDEYAMLPSPASWEAPVMMKHNNRYFVVGGHNCCACKGGSNAFVMTAIGSPLANWTYVSDIGDNKTQCEQQQPPVCTRGGHSPLQWSDHAQTAAAFTVQEVGKAEPTNIMLSNQWVSAPPPQRARNADLLYWNAVRFDERTEMPLHIEWADTLSLRLKNDDTKAPGANWTAFRLDQAAKTHNAVCLDGSPPLYYHSPGTGDGADKWEIHMEGGAWCGSAQECTGWWGFRSSTVDPDSLAPDAQAVTGYFNRSLETNPMKDWNYIFVRYCDGWSFAGNRDEPQIAQVTNHTTKVVSNVTVHMRGRAILDAVIADLLTERGMRTATDVVVGGCSAGGMAVYLNCDHWAESIAAANAKASVRCLADAGWFPLIPTANDCPHGCFEGIRFPSEWFNGVWRTGFSNHNASVSMHPKCLADHNASTEWLCTMPQVAAKYVKTPLFAFNSKYDAFQIPNMERCLGNATDKFAPCTPAQMTAWGSMLTSQVKEWLATPLAQASGHAAFLSSCYFHCGSKPTIGVVKSGEKGITGMQAFANWRTKPTNTLWDTSAPWNSSTGCGVLVPPPSAKLDDETAADREPNPPVWPSTVHVFGPGSPEINTTVTALYANQDVYQDRHAALLFKPGWYDVDIPVGYYTTVHGLGADPSDVAFAGEAGVHQAAPGRNLITFWRSAENLANRPKSGRVVWSVSQAAPLRRMIIDADLVFGAEADTQGSGGFVAGVRVTGVLNYTMQQQWITRNSVLGGGASYFSDPPRSVNFVYVGTTGTPVATTACTNAATARVSPSPQQLVVDTAPVSMEKPYITISREGKYQLVTPRAKRDSSGLQWSAADDYIDGFEKVFVASNSTAVTDINAKLAQGLHVILCPGIYSLPEPIRIGRAGSDHQVLLGLGLATLIPLHGEAAVQIEEAAGVRVAGILLQAGPITSKALLSVGTSPSDGEAANPTLLADVFARVGGPGVDPETGLGPSVSADVMMEVNASHVVLDNVWLWRADVQNQHRPRDCNHSLVVNGHAVTAYGLAAEHVQSDNIVWNGEDGKVYFYQAELDGLAHTPGDKTPDFGPNGVSGYRVNAKSHLGVGVGVYCWFSSPGIVVQSGVKVLHNETKSAAVQPGNLSSGIVCPFQWVWENANTPPKGSSTIEAAILAVGEVPPRPAP